MPYKCWSFTETLSCSVLVTMGTQLWTWTIWLFILVGAVTQTHVTGSETCKQECPSTSTSVFHYQDGHKYTYNLEGTTITTLPGTQGDVSKLQLRATVELSVQSACSHLVKLKGVQVIGPDSKKYGSLKELETHPVIANFQGGVINSQICTEDGDSQAGLNLKRAILSLLQTPVSAGAGSSNIREVDVFGSCPTEITSSKEGDVTIVRKTRNLNRCSHREDLKQDVLSTPFVGNADLQSTPLLDSSYSAEQQIKKGVISSAASHESYLFRPFSRQGSGAKTTVETKLTLISDKAQATPAPASINVPRSIIFEAPHEAGATGNANNKQAILDALQAAAVSVKAEVGPTAARKFSALVSILRHSTKEDILSVYGQVKAGAGLSNKETARKILLDALFRTGTGDSVIVAVELLKSHEISGDYSKLWYTGFGFVRHASLSSLAAVSTLLDEPNLPREALLGIGSLAGRYCREHNCENVATFNELIGKLAKQLKTKVTSIGEENNVIAALKALSNIHHLNDAVAETLQQVASETSLPARVRVAALETFQSDACRANLKKTALEILNNQLEDSEIRIKAYLVLVECPSGTVANNLKGLLEKEPTNQVGSYIVSHLRNLRASTNPSKAEAKHHLRLLKPRKHFPEDFRKYSHNYELSYILDALNIGTSVESNLIYSQSSYIPRSASLNLTTEVFGHSYNVLEINTRSENADRILESYIGPKGYLNTHSWDEIVKTAQETLNKYGDKIKEKFQETIRNKRSVNQNDLERIRNEVIKSLPPSHKGKELILDLSFKLFGSELAWLNCDHNTHELSSEGIVNRVFDILNGAIDKAKHFSHDVKQHWTFLDTELTYPTGLGLPLRLVASGSTAAHLKLEGQIDIPALLRNPGSSVVQIDVIPSAAIEITGELLVDAYAVESGLKVAYTLHTATGVNVAIKGLNGEGVDINVGLPLKKQDILTVKTEVLSTVHERGHSEVDTPLQFTVNRKDYQGCFDQVSAIIGLTMCTEFGFPFDTQGRTSALYPLNGPSILSLKLESEDVSSYHFRVLVKDKDPKHSSLELLFETPNSQVDRKLALLIEGNSEPNKEIKVSLKSPWKTLAVQGILVDTNEEKSATAKFLNDAEEYSLKVGAKVAGDPNLQTYTPLLEYKSPDQKERQVAKGRKTSAKSTQGYNVQGTVTVDKQSNSQKVTFNRVSLNTPQGHLEVHGTIEKDVNSFSSDIKITYGSQNIILKSDLQKVGDSHYKIRASVIPSKQRDLGVDFSWECERKKDEVKNDLVIIHGSDLKSATNRITISQLLHLKYESPTDFDIHTKNSLTYPLLNVNLKLDGSAVPNNINYDLIISYDSYKIASKLNAKTAVKKQGDYDIDFVAQILNSNLKIKSIREIIAPDQSKFTNVLELSQIVKYELISEVTHLYQRNNINLQILSLLKIDGQPKEYKLDLGIILNPQLLDTHTKLVVGPDTIVDSNVVINKDTAKPKGNVKLYIKNYIDATSTYNYNKGGGQATLSIDLPKINRKIRGNADLTITGTVHVGKLDLHWNADEDPSQKLSIQTTSDIKPESIDSKNTIIILNYKTILNIKGALTGKMDDGHLIANGDLTLPNGRQITVKYDRTLHIRQTNSEGRVEIVLIDIPQKGSRPRKLSLEAVAKDIDPEQLSFEGSGKLEYKSSEGKDLKVTINAKNIPQGQQNIIGGEALLEGSLIPKPLKLKLNAEVSKAVITYKASGGYGSDSSLNVAGTVRTGLGGTSPRQIDNTVELKIPTEPLKQLKLTTTLSLSTQPDTPCELKTNNVLVWNNDNTLKFEGQIAGDKVHGSGKVVITLPKEQARSLAVTWSNPEEGESGLKKAGSLTLHWDGSKEVKVAGEIEIPQDKMSYKLKLTASTPAEKLQNLDLTLSSKQSETPVKHIETDAILILNDKKITVTCKIGLAPGIPVIDFTAIHPLGTSKVYLNVDKFTSDHVKLQTNIQYAAYGGGTLTSDGEIKLSMDDFKLVWNVDSPKLKINKWHVEAGHTAIKGVKKIIFSVTSAEKKILAGSTSLRSKVDGNSVTYDGAGSVLIGEQSQRFNFHVERIRLLQDTNDETGIEYKANVQVGPKKFEGALKLTNKEVHFLNKYCTKSEDCAIVEAKSRLIVADVTEVNHELILIIDLKALEIPHGMDLKAKTVRHNLNIDQEIDLQIHSKEHETKYSSKVQISEKNAVVTITLPQRVIALEVTANIEVEGTGGRQKVGFILWWDKVRKPASRSVGSVIITHNSDKNGLHLSGEARFNNPSLERELVISGQSLIGGANKLVDSSLDIDIFKNKNQKITALYQILQENIDQGYNISHTGEIKSKGQNLDIFFVEYAVASLTSVGYGFILNYKTSKQPKKEVIMTLDATLESLNVLVKLPNADILHVDGTLKRAHDFPVVDAEVDIIGLEPLVLHSAVEKKGLLTFSSYIHKKNTPNNKLQISGGIDGGAGLRAVVINGGDKKELFHVFLSTKDEDFLKTDFGWSTENIKNLVGVIRQDISKLLNKVKEVVTDYVKQLKDELIALLDTLRKNQPSIKRLLEVGQQQLKAIRNEIANDEVLRDISKNVQAIFGDIVSSLEEATKGISDTVDALLTAIEEFETALIESLKNASPAISEEWTKIVNAVVGILETVLEEISGYVAEAAKILQAHEAELKRLVSIVTELFQDVGQVSSKALHKIIQELSDFGKIIIDELKSLQIYTLTKEKYAEILEDLAKLEIPTNAWSPIQEILSYVKDTLPTEELQELVSSIESYIDKRIHKQPVDNKAELQSIYDKLVRAIKSIIALLRSHITEPEPGTGLLGYKIPISFNNLLQLPRIIAIRLSPLSYLTSDDLPSLTELYYTYRPTLNPLDWIPPFRAYGILIDSNHFFTFDRRHYTLKGSCSYVLAQDYEDGNYSIVVTLEGGRLKSITISDNSDSIELLADKSLKVNGAVTEYPVKQGEFVAWRQYNSANIRTKAGVYIHCHTDINICLFHFSGFYFGRTRGLLGTINNEQWDDFSLPNGHVASKSSEFANAWKLNAQCADVTEERTGSDTPVSECTDVFSGNTDLRACFPFVNPAPFREACNEGVRNIQTPSEKKQAACTFAASYVEICKSETLIINIPRSCVHCNAIGGNEFGIGETVSVKVPQRSADVVIVTEQVLGNAEIFKELVIPLVSTLTNDLKSKGISDVKFSLIGYGAPGQKWPAHYTLGGELGFNSKNIQFPEPEPITDIPLDSTTNALKWFKQILHIQLGRVRLIEAFSEATHYPFRVGAVKTIIGVVATPCEKTNILEPLRLLITQKMYRELGISVHLVTPVQNIHAAGKEEKHLKQIVGFDSETVYSQSDAKKRTLDGDTDLRNVLDYTPSLCVATVQKTYGAVFNTNNFLNAKPAGKKQFLQVVSHRIADSLTTAELTEDCTCLLLHGVHPSPLCRVTNRREKEQTKNIKGVKG